MSRHLDGSPKPVDPIWYRKRETMHLRYRFGHAHSEMVGALAWRGGMSRDRHLYRPVALLRYFRCGEGHPADEVGLRR